MGGGRWVVVDARWIGPAQGSCSVSDVGASAVACWGPVGVAAVLCGGRVRGRRLEAVVHALDVELHAGLGAGGGRRRDGEAEGCLGQGGRDARQPKHSIIRLFIDSSPPHPPRAKMGGAILWKKSE